MNKLNMLCILIVLFSCNKGKDVTDSSDCFKNLSSSPYQTGPACGNMLVTVNLDNHKLVSIFLNEQALDLKTVCKSFKVEDDTSDIQINYYTYAHHPDSVYFNFCDDIAYMKYGAKTTWKAVSGNVTAVVSKDRSVRAECEAYHASIELRNVRFIKENSTQDTILSSLIIKDKTVGICIP